MTGWWISQGRVYDRYIKGKGASGVGDLKIIQHEAQADMISSRLGMATICSIIECLVKAYYFQV